KQRRSGTCSCRSRARPTGFRGNCCARSRSCATRRRVTATSTGIVVSSLLLAYLRERLIDPKAFASAVNETIARALDRLAGFDHPCLDDDLYDALGDRVVEYYRHYGSQPHWRNPELQR